MPRRGKGVPSSVPVHCYPLRSLGPINNTMVGDDELSEAVSPTDPDMRLTNVERSLASLTTQMGQLLSRLPLIPDPPTTGFSTPRHTLDDDGRGGGSASRGRGLAMLSSLRARGGVIGGRGRPVEDDATDDGRPGRRLRPIDTSRMDKLHANPTRCNSCYAEAVQKSMGRFLKPQPAPWISIGGAASSVEDGHGRFNAARRRVHVGHQA